MGREIRRVPLAWEHPKYTAEDAPYQNRIGHYKPVYDRSYSEARTEWLEGLRAWEAGENPDRDKHPDYDYWEWEGAPPDRAYYMPDLPEDTPLGYAFYETVTEGTPLSPTFATPEELAEWLSSNQDYWGRGPMSAEQAQRFVAAGWAPSFIAGPGISGLQPGYLVTPDA